MSLIKHTPPSPCNDGQCNPLILTLKNPKLTDNGTYVLGVWLSGRDPLGLFSIYVNKPKSSKTKKINTTQPNITSITDTSTTGVKYLANVSMEEKLALETGYAERNYWMEWMMYTARQTDRNNCIACSTARPQLGTAPFRLTSSSDTTGLQCVLSSFNRTTKPTTDQCKSLDLLFPPVKDQLPPQAVAIAGNYTCFSKSGLGASLGTLEWCNQTIDVTIDNGNYSASWFVDQTTSRADLWWLCGDKKLRARLPQGPWRGSCALVQLLMPFQMFAMGDFKHLSKMLHEKQPHHHRPKRITTPGGAFDGRVYIDAIGVPRGVPNEFKARN